MTPLMPARFLMALISLAVLSLPGAKAEPPTATLVWNKAVDGLEAGIELTTAGVSANRRAPLNSRVDYKVLVRNVSSHERVLEIHSTPTPYLIPNDNLANALRARVLPERFRALNALDLSSASGVYDVKLAPGEAVVVRGELGMYLGAADLQSFPRVESVPTGKNWIIQPIRIHELNSAEKFQYEKLNASPYTEKRVVTILGRDGKTSEVSTSLIGGHVDGKLLLARIPIDVETRK